MELTNEQIARYACMPCVDKLDETMAWMAGEVLKTRAERDALAAEVERLREANRWIPVKDINLKNATRVDVFMVNEWQEKATYFTHGWKGEKLEHHPCWKNDIGEILSGVTHYRPLPPPPQENEVEE